VVPPGVPVPPVGDVGAVHALPAELQALVLDAFVAALHPVFLTAAALGAAAFVLTWFLPGVPLRKTTEAEGLGESFASPRDGDSFRELERAVSVLSRRDERWDVYNRLGARAGLELAPPSLWLLGRLGERSPAPESALAGELGTDRSALAAALADLRDRGLVEPGGDGRPVVLARPGRAAHDRFVTARKEGLRVLLRGWDVDEQPEVRELVDELARAYVSEMPAPARAVTGS
jgi:DNA-binding MarR family transcriptional regulator